MALIATNAIKIQRSAAVIEPLVVTHNDSYAPPSGVDGFNPVTVNVAFKTQERMVSPSLLVQEVTPVSGYDGLSKVTVNAMPQGSEGTPSATKSAVSNHSVTITPKVTNATGYITGGEKTGTAVTVTASELVSGTKTITENGTGIDVADYAEVDVDVPAGTDVSDTTATAADVLAGKSFHLADGTKTTGTIPSQAAQTIYPSVSDQIIAADKYLAGAQTVKGVKISQTLTAENIAQGVTVEIGDTDDPDRLVSIVGTHQGGGGVDIETLNVTENRTYNAPTGKAYGTVNVNVPTYDWKGTYLSNYSIYKTLDKSWEESA